MNKEIRSKDEQIFDLLVTSQHTYAEIGKRVGCAPSTVANHAKKMVEDYNLNPSILRTSGKPRFYARYCQNILCHEIIYLSSEEIKNQKEAFCSPGCVSAQKVPLPAETKVRSLYKKEGFVSTAKQLDLSFGFLARVFEHYNISPEDFPENVLVTPANVAQRQTQRIKQRRSAFSNTRTGFRKHLGFTVRSSWENNFCLYLQHKNIKYEYEPKTFYFPERTGATAYVPDFKLTINRREVWCEVKGRIDSKDRTKMRRMREHFPDVFRKMTYVAEKPGCKADLSYKKLGLKPFVYYNDINKEFGNILKYWEN